MVISKEQFQEFKDSVKINKGIEYLVIGQRWKTASFSIGLILTHQYIKELDFIYKMINTKGFDSAWNQALKDFN